MSLKPDFAEFQRLAQTHTLVPVVKSVGADLLTPVSAFLNLAAGEREAFLLESVVGGESIGRYTFLGIRPYMRLTCRRSKVQIERGKRRESVSANCFAALKELLREHNPARLAGLPPFTAGAVGFFAYDAVRQLERLPERARRDVDLPDCILLFFDRLLAFDHVRQQIRIIAVADVKKESPRSAYERARHDIVVLEKRLHAGQKAHTLRAANPAKEIDVRTRTTKEQYLASIERAKEYIAAGDVYQVVLSQRLEMKLKADPFDVYRALRTLNPSPYMYFLRTEGLTILGSSPEMLVKVEGRKLSYRPIAGTRPRGADDAEDKRLEEELRHDEKERAEHVMLVDLGRNDVGRVSEYGSVKVHELMTVERYSHVMHLVSAIEGRLRPELDAIDALAACFPAGTLSGAPKVRAMEIIEELEPVRRGVYGGSVLYADFAGNLDSCIAIRTMLVRDRRAYVQAGAGIVADSNPESEYEECLSKAQALVRAAELAGG